MVGAWYHLAARGQNRLRIYEDARDYRDFLARAAELRKLTWDEADGIKRRAVRRGLTRRQIIGPEYVSVDEKAVGRGQDYVTVVTGVVGGDPHVLYVGDGRDEAALNGFWEWLGPEACAGIKAVSMDMSQSYQNSTRRYCPDADLIFDPFHHDEDAEQGRG